MKTAAFSDALTYLDDELVNEVRTKRNAPRTAWMGWAAAAACLALVIYAGVHLRPAPSPVTPVTPGTETVTPAQPTTPGERALIYRSDVPDASETACYATPWPGTCNYTLGVRAALEKYGWEISDESWDVCPTMVVPGADAEKFTDGPAFLLAFDLFGRYEEKEVELDDGTVELRNVPVAITEEKKAAEYRRLQEAGIELFETQVWEFEDQRRMSGAHVPCTVVTAMVTGEQLANFPVSQDYGYFFYFPHNGDYSGPEGVPGDALILPELWPHR